MLQHRLQVEIDVLQFHCMHITRLCDFGTIREQNQCFSIQTTTSCFVVFSLLFISRWYSSSPCARLETAAFSNECEKREKNVFSLWFIYYICFQTTAIRWNLLSSFVFTGLNYMCCVLVCWLGLGMVCSQRIYIKNPHKSQIIIYANFLLFSLWLRLAGRKEENSLFFCFFLLRICALCDRLLSNRTTESSIENGSSVNCRH